MYLYDPHVHIPELTLQTSENEMHIGFEFKHFCCSCYSFWGCNPARTIGFDFQFGGILLCVSGNVLQLRPSRRQARRCRPSTFCPLRRPLVRREVLLT